MILPDANLLVYACNVGVPFHIKARSWWEDLLSGNEPVALPWTVMHGFVRLVTHPRILEKPQSPGEAVRHVREWIEHPSVQIIEPGPRHLDIFEALIKQVGVGGNLTTDAQLAALAIEYQCELHTNDADFSRFSGLRWRNPLQ